MAKQNKPAIRFKGFTDAWEQRKLSEIAGKVTEKNTGLQYVETLTNSAEFGIISQRDFFDHDIAKLGSLDGYYIVKSEDFVYNPRISTSAPVGPINRNKLGRTGVMSPLYTVFRPHDIDTTYLEHFFKCGYWYSFMNFNGDSGARSDRFSIKDDVFFQMPIPVPHIEEQRKIGLFLTQLDQLITLHQRKYDKLQVLKKAMLEKMFPKNGSSVPEIRFKGFTDAWEQRKLGEFFEKYQNTVYLQDEEEYRQISIRNTGVVEYRCTNKGKNIGRKRQYLIDTDTHPVTLTFTRQTVYEGGIGFVPKELNGAIVTENMPLLEMTNASQDFMKALFNTSGYYKSVINDDTLIGSAQKALHEKQWLDSYVCIPVLDEQKQIGSFFQQLEHLITLHQRELEKLQNIKKSMLEKMFV